MTARGGGSIRWIDSWVAARAAPLPGLDEIVDDDCVLRGVTAGSYDDTSGGVGSIGFAIGCA